MTALTALNYSAHALEDLVRFRDVVGLFFYLDGRIADSLVKMLRDSVKFILPDHGQLLDPNSLTKTHLDLLRLPFPCIALEAPYSGDLVIKEFAGMEQMSCSRRIALCWDIETTPDVLSHLRMPYDQDGTRGAMVLPISYIDSEKTWTPGIGGVFLPHENDFLCIDPEEAPDYQRNEYEAMKKAGHAPKKLKTFVSSPFILFPEQFERTFGDDRETGFQTILHDSREEAQMLVEACAVMNCENVGLDVLKPSAKLNKARAAKGRQEFFSYHVLALAPGRLSAQSASAGGGTHASPRMHLRRGHIRRLEKKNVWVRDAIVGMDAEGSVTKSYRISG